MITFSNIPESVQRTLFDRMDMLDRNTLKTKIGDPIAVEAGQPKINYMNGRSVFMRMISLQPPASNPRPVILSGGRGTRLKPYTEILTKPLLPINQNPAIRHILEKFNYYSPTKFFITVNYKLEKYGRITFLNSLPQLLSYR